jgi:hypothetical protein
MGLTQVAQSGAKSRVEAYVSAEPPPVCADI